MIIQKMKRNRLLKNYFQKFWLISIILVSVFLGKSYLEGELNELKFVSQEVRVVDGDTIILNNMRIRLQGIDAPELKQTCYNIETMQSYKCGEVAKEYLISLIDKKEVSCSDEGIDKYGRRLSYCYVAGNNINLEMVRAGNAIAYIKYDLRFVKEEMQARWNKVGIWASKFERPGSFRKNKKFN